MTITEWLDTAVRRLPYRERTAARQELMDHFLDHAEALEASNYSREAAEAEALAALGDPEETSRLLVKVHRPWLNWVLWGLRITLAGILVYAVIMLPQIRAGIQNQRNLRDWLAFEEGSRDGPIDPVLARRDGSCRESCKLGEFQITVHCARSELRRNVLAEEQDWHYDESRVLDVVLRFEAPPWRTPDKGALLRCLGVKDDQGRDYRPLGDSAETLTGHYSLNYMGKDLSASYYQLCVLREPDLDYLDLSFQNGGEYGSLRVRFGPWRFREGILLGTLEREEDAVEGLLKLPQSLPEDVPVLEPQEAGRGDAASNEQLSASVPWVRSFRCRDRSGRDMDNPELLELILVLWGPAEQLPQTHGELFSRLTVTDGAGTQYPLERPWDCFWAVYEPLRWENAVAYRLQLPSWYGGSADTLNLVYAGDGGPLELRLEAKEDTP